MQILPQSIPAGLTFDRTLTLTAYQAGVWSLSVALRGPSVIDINGTAVGNQHRLKVAASDTAAWTPGRYWYSVRATSPDTGDVVEVEAGEVTITPDVAEATAGYDGTSHAQRVLDSIEAVLEKRATQDQQRYKINNRELWRTPIAELLMLRDRYRAQVRMSRLAKTGNLFGNAVRVRFRNGV